MSQHFRHAKQMLEPRPFLLIRDFRTTLLPGSCYSYALVPMCSHFYVSVRTYTTIRPAGPEGRFGVFWRKGLIAPPEACGTGSGYSIGEVQGLERAQTATRAYPSIRCVTGAQHRLGEARMRLMAKNPK